VDGRSGAYSRGIVLVEAATGLQFPPTNCWAGNENVSLIAMRAMLDSYSQQVALQILDDAASLSPDNGSLLPFLIFRLALRYTGSRIH
jgi:hypothetical protein